jgi:hypothetical protein
MAIRPTDLQTSFILTAQTPPTAQRAEENPRAAQLAAQNVFVAQTEERNETVKETGNAEGNRIEVNDRQREQQQPGRRRRRHVPGTPFEEPEAAVPPEDDRPHLIDFTA